MKYKLVLILMLLATGIVGVVRAEDVKGGNLTINCLVNHGEGGCPGYPDYDIVKPDYKPDTVQPDSFLVVLNSELKEIYRITEKDILSLSKKEIRDMAIAIIFLQYVTDSEIVDKICDDFLPERFKVEENKK